MLRMAHTAEWCHSVRELLQKITPVKLPKISLHYSKEKRNETLPELHACSLQGIAFVATPTQSYRFQLLSVCSQPHYWLHNHESIHHEFQLLTINEIDY